MAKHITDFCEDKARSGKGQYAIAFALLKLADATDRLATKTGQLGFDGPGDNPGALEYIGMELRDLPEKLNGLSVSVNGA